MIRKTIWITKRLQKNIIGSFLNVNIMIMFFCVQHGSNDLNGDLMIKNWVVFDCFNSWKTTLKFSSSSYFHEGSILVIHLFFQRRFFLQKINWTFIIHLSHSDEWLFEPWFFHIFHWKFLINWMNINFPLPKYHLLKEPSEIDNREPMCKRCNEKWLNRDSSNQPLTENAIYQIYNLSNGFFTENIQFAEWHLLPKN